MALARPLSCGIQPTHAKSLSCIRPLCLARRRSVLVVRASNTPGDSPSDSPSGGGVGVQQQEPVATPQEASPRGKKSPKPPRAPKPPRQIEILGVTQPKQAKEVAPYAKGEWREGQLFPDGWEEMDLFEKAGQLYMGKRGALFWSAKLSLAGCAVLGVSWIVFRLVLPALGLYQLE